MTRRRTRFSVLAALVLAALLLSACGHEEHKAIPASQRAAMSSPTPAPTAEPAESPPPETAEPSPTPVPAPAEFDGIRALLGEGRYYEAFQRMLDYEQSHTAPEEVAACEALFGELDALLREIEPTSGTELARSFAVQGGGVLEVSAWSGPALVTVTDANAVPQPELAPAFVRFYVRQGEQAEIHLPAGSYRVRYEVGYRWFGEEVGFGEYCTEGELDEPLLFDFYLDSGWASNSKYTITL